MRLSLLESHRERACYSLVQHAYPSFLLSCEGCTSIPYSFIWLCMGCHTKCRSGVYDRRRVYLVVHWSRESIASGLVILRGVFTELWRFES